MNNTATLEDTLPAVDGVTDRLHRVEDEVAELRHTVTELAEIVVGDIRDRREAALAVSAPVADIPIPPSLAAAAPATSNPASATRRPWLLSEVLRDVGTTIRMYTDPRYRVRRATQIMVPILLASFGLNYLLFNHTILDVPVFRHILERVVDIVLAVLLYKVVSREVARYRHMVIQLAGAPRSWNPTPVSLLHTDPDTAAVTRLESP
jgi:hypothetical protein